ncbi:hypothetical protein M501DRAFT_941012 [Patellaria atrata CBS 101060]|uniref:Reverse transcriptase domain-containing protein n=1 Tax=Patellaria atrata CBS 101060 TaxID=1346257 RepID=A0A9P4S3Z6_9PEZI|nr:hypothetical protein M501DRAFT_941012 [Patellaria atrata CBS 101060]
MAAAVLSTLHHVTERKLSKLADQREKYESEKKSILDAVAAAPHQRSKVCKLLDGYDDYNIDMRQIGLSAKNLDRFIRQSHYDPSVSPHMLKDWQAKLEHGLDIQSLKYEYASLFGNLVTEWIKNPNDALLTTPDSGSSTFSHVGREEMHEQRKQWESYAFTEKKVDQSKIEKYLDELFGSTLQSKKVKKTPLKELRDSMKKVMDFKSDLKDKKEDYETDRIVTSHERFTIDKLKICIKGVLKADLFVGKKREALVDLQSRTTVLSEMVDVLNMDLDSLDEWQWEPSPVPMQMRRQLNGKYRAFMDEEIHQAILLHFIGTTWAVALKDAFIKFYHSGAWTQSPYRSISKKGKERREYFLGDSRLETNSVRNMRRAMYQENYFMTQLPDSASLTPRDYNDETDSGVDDTKTPLAIKQSMLRLITAEMLLNTKIYGEFNILQSDFKWFGPSLPHDTIFAVLKFFGVPGKWLRFFQRFLSSPVVFVQDGPDAQPQIRKCGIPMSHVLSDAFGEAVMFCLDFAMNKRTKGANIYRFHDDLWFWGQESVVVDGWNALKEFSTIMGMELNEEKTGATKIVDDPKKKNAKVPTSLPSGKIRWGFLYLDSVEGRWIIDREQVDTHIAELRLQLGACRSVFAWVQAWNSYVSRFFSTNFGQPANCFGRKHLDMVIETFEHIQLKLFSDTGSGNVTDYLRGMLKERFGAEHVPDGFFYFPVELGGLELRNPFVTLYTSYKLSPRNVTKRIDQAFEEETDEYDRLKKQWNKGELASQQRRSRVIRPQDASESESDEPFMTFEEFTRYQEETSTHLSKAFSFLLAVPGEETVEETADVKKAFSTLPTTLTWHAEAKKPYWAWIVQLYAGHLVERFGGLQLGEKSLLPVGLVDVLKSERVRWMG